MYMSVFEFSVGLQAFFAGRPLILELTDSCAGKRAFGFSPVWGFSSFTVNLDFGVLRAATEALEVPEAVRFFRNLGMNMATNSGWSG